MSDECSLGRGDLVQLLSGGPVMIVLYVSPSEYAETMWFDIAGHVQTTQFKIDLLMFADPDGD